MNKLHTLIKVGVIFSRETTDGYKDSFIIRSFIFSDQTYRLPSHIIMKLLEGIKNEPQTKLLTL